MTEDAPEGATPPTPEALVERAFGADNRRRMLEEYFATAGQVTPANAWEHVYRLLLWIDPTTGLAHCYESDKSQPGRPWYKRSLAFHAWLADALRVPPAQVADEIDWLFKRATQLLAAAIARDRDRRTSLVTTQRKAYQGRGMPEAGQDPTLERIVAEELGTYFARQPPAEVLQRLAQRVRTYMMEENKRRNLIGEGFEDVLAFVLNLLPERPSLEIGTRTMLSKIPGFNEPRGDEKEEQVDLVILGPNRPRTLVTAKWSIRADREKQFDSDFTTYAGLEAAGEDFAYVLVTNEFDAARLVRACERRRQNAALFTTVVHLNPEGPRTVHRDTPRRSARQLPGHIDRGRLMSLEQWLTSLLAR